MGISMRPIVAGVAAAVVLASAGHANAKKIDRQAGDPKIALYPGESSEGTTGEVYDCYQKRSRFGGLFATDDGKKHRSMALDAAREAIDQGYNYAVLAPLRFVTDNYSSRRTRWESVGSDLGVGPFGMVATTTYAPVTRTSRSSRARYFLACTAVDDFDAYRIMWNDHPRYAVADGEKLVDLRSLVANLGPGVEGSRYRAPPPARPIISDLHYSRPGSRERIAAQLVAMRGAARCRREHRSVDPETLRFARVGYAQARAENNCLEQYREAAVQSGWRGFPLTTRDRVDEVADRGFLLRTDGNAQRSGGLSGRTAIDSANWGDAIEYPDFALNGPGLDNVFAVYEKNQFGNPRTLAMVASNTLPKDRLLEIAIFMGANEWLGDEWSGVNYHERSYVQFRRQFDFRRKSRSSERPSADITVAGINKAAFRAFEDYRNVVILNNYRTPNSKPCDPRSIACADKLQAYNRLGPKVVGPGFVPLQTPPGYEPYVPR